MDSSTSAILQAMEAAEPAEATAVLDRLTEHFDRHQGHGINLARMWTSFRHLLHRRGYFVSTPAEVEIALEEIAAVGEGFDLYDLARRLAHFDAVRMESLGLKGHRALPELRRFAVRKD